MNNAYVNRSAGEKTAEWESASMHMVRYGINREAQYMSGEFVDTYDLAVMNGNMVAHTPSALARFVGQKAQNKRYLIDPQTHAFQHDFRYLAPEEGKEATREQPAQERESTGESSTQAGESTENRPTPVRASIQRLARALGAPVRTALEEGRAVEPDDFSDRGLRREFIRRVLAFQADSLRERDEGSLVKYYEYVGITGALRPMALIAPYFYMDEDTLDHWAPVNERMLKESLEINPYDLPLFAQVGIAQPVLWLDTLKERVISYLRDSKPDGIALWVDNMDETKATAKLLQAYRALIRDLSAIARVYLLYGSYFAVVMMRFLEDVDIAGVCHSLEYGEHRPVRPVGGGFPVSKFYYPRAHARLPFAEAYRLAREHLVDWRSYEQHVCGCKVCGEVILSARSPDAGFQRFGDTLDIAITRGGQLATISVPSVTARDLAVRHYMFCKQREFQEDTSLAKVIGDLEEEYKVLSTKILNASLVKHLDRWVAVLSGGEKE